MRTGLLAFYPTLAQSPATGSVSTWTKPIEDVVAIYGMLKAGGIYVPREPRAPTRDRRTLRATAGFG
jgi:hypothetical protein